MTATAQTGTPRTVVDDFFCKDIPEPFQILGLKLLPLSIGRYRRMARHGVAFVSESETTADGKDLLLGVLICSMTCEEFDHLSIDKSLPKIIARWMRLIKAVPPIVPSGAFTKILAAAWEIIWGKRWRKTHSFDLLEKMKLFKGFIEEAQNIPRYLTKQQGQSSSSSHWSHNIEVVLRGELGWTRDEIEERPLSSAIADYFKHMENQGLITILTESDYQQIQQNNEAMARAEAEYAKKGAI